MYYLQVDVARLCLLPFLKNDFCPISNQPLFSPTIPDGWTRPSVDSHRPVLPKMLEKQIKTTPEIRESLVYFDCLLSVTWRTSPVQSSPRTHNGHERPTSIHIFNHDDIAVIGSEFCPIFPNVSSYHKVILRFYIDKIWFRLTQTLGFSTTVTLLLAA